MKFWQHWFGLKDRHNYQRRLMESLLAMAWFVEARDPYTGGHLWRVSRYTRVLADAAGLSDTESARVSLGGFLHDLGKVGVPDAILRKPGPLTDEEYAIMKTHPDVGMKLLAGHPLASLVQDAVSKHHERPDGQGYPYRLKGQDIPLDVRVVGICDAFDAITSHRPYRGGRSKELALSIIEKESGHQFDADLAGVFCELGKGRSLDQIMGHSDDGIPLQSCPMCGPTLVIRREQVANELMYCRNCSGEFKLGKSHDGGLMAKPTGRQGNAVALEPEADMALIARTVSHIVEALPLEQLIAQSAQSQFN